MPQINGYYSQVSFEYYNNAYRIVTPSFNAEVNNTIALNKSKTLLAELGARYQSALQKELDLKRGYSIIWGGIKAVLFHDGLVAAINFNDPFNSDYRRLENRYNRTYAQTYPDRRNFQISLTWKFGNENVKKADKDDKTLSEANRAG